MAMIGVNNYKMNGELIKMLDLVLLCIVLNCLYRIVMLVGSLIFGRNTHPDYLVHCIEIFPFLYYSCHMII